MTAGSRCPPLTHGQRAAARPANALGFLALVATLGTLLLRVGHPQRARRSWLTRIPHSTATSVLRRRDDSGSAQSVPACAEPLPEARSLQRAAALLASSVLVDSALEHYRGSFENPGMLAPLLASALTVVCGVRSGFALAPHETPMAGTVYATAVGVGVAGTGFHVYNITKRPGGVSWLNLFYAAPVGAPAALSIAGLIGLAARRLLRLRCLAPPRLLGAPAGRVLALLTGVGLAGTVAEAGLLHFRGAFHNPFMWVPVTLPPVASLLMLRAAFGSRQQRWARLTRRWLRLTAGLGFAGVGFHAYGVSRAMGGWRNWSQNVIDGPPLPAPPGFAALALAGLGAVSLLDRGE